MAGKNSRIVAGFVFENEAEAELAAKEAGGVKYIKAKAEMDNPEMVLRIYNKIIRQGLFETAVGLAYLKDLQDYLISIPSVAKDEVLPIPISHKTLEKEIWKKSRQKPKPESGKKEVSVRKVKKTPDRRELSYRTKFRFVLLLAVIMAFSMGGMFFITASSNNLNILNYENEIINRYASWEKELTEREAVIRKQEEILGITRQE